MSPPNSWDTNLVDYVTWSVIQQRVYETRVHDIDELRQRLLHVCLCSCRRRTFWTYFVTINLFSLYLINFMFHIIRRAAGDVLAVYYKSSGGESGRRGHPPRAALRRGRHLEGRKYGILKFGRFWQIAICILHPLTLPRFWDHTRNCQWSTTPHKTVCTPRNFHCWSDWSFTCCKTVQKIHTVYLPFY